MGEFSSILSTSKRDLELLFFFMRQVESWVEEGEISTIMSMRRLEAARSDTIRSPHFTRDEPRERLGAWHLPLCKNAAFGKACR